MVILAGIRVAADPATWTWMFPEPQQAAGTTLADVSYAVDLPGGELRSDEFRSVAASVTPTDPTAAIDTTVRAEPSSFMPPGTFDGVRDNTLTLQPAEREAYFGTLNRLRDAKAIAFNAADRQVSFPVLNIDPGPYRGRLIGIDGLARRIVEVPAGRNEAGIKTVYDLWVFTPDSGINPWHVVAIDIDPSLPRGEAIDPGVPVKLTGVFFKRQGYETARGELHVAPLLLARTVRRAARPPIAPGPDTVDLAPWVVGGLATLLMAGLILVWRLRAADRRFEQTTLRRLAPKPGERDVVPAVEPADPATDPVEFLRRLQASEPADPK